MFPNNSLKSISPDVRVMQAFPNINLGGKPQQIVEDKERKHPRSRFTSHYGFFITAAPPKLSKIRLFRSFTGTLRDSILHSPQGAQGGDLGLGQALDARDSEPLVGPVAAQRAHMLATFELPDVDGSVIATTGQQLPIGTLPEREDRSLMCCSHPQAFSALYIPPAQYPITPSADQEVPSRRPDDGIDNTGMSCKGLEAFPAPHIPHEQFPCITAAATTGQQCAIGTPDHTRGHSLVPRQPLLQRAIGNPPQVQAPIIATTDHPRAVWAPGYIVDDGREGTPVPKEALLCHIPHLDAMLIGSPSEQLPIWTPGHIQW